MKKILMTMAATLLLFGGKGTTETLTRNDKGVQRAVYNDGLGNVHFFPQTNYENLLTEASVISSEKDSGGYVNMEFSVSETAVNHVRNGEQGDALLFITSAPGIYMDTVILGDENDYKSSLTVSTFVTNDVTYSYVWISDELNATVTGSEVTISLAFPAEDITTNEYYLFASDFRDEANTYLTGKQDTAGPLLSGANVNYYTNVESPISVETIKSKLTAVDETDGDVTDSIVIAEDNYTGHESELGAHTVKFEASDSVGNKSYLTVTIWVKDVTSPTITGPDTLTYSYDDVISEDAFLLNFTASDNCDTSLTMTTSYPTNIFDKANELGTYTVNIRCSDSSGNETVKTVSVIIEDTKAPVIEGPTTITKRNSVILTTSDILAQYSANDAYDGACDVYIIEDNYTGNGDKIGQYMITFGAKDQSGNIGTKVLTVDVVDDIAPVWYVDQTLIYVDASVTLTHQDIIQLMIANGEIASNYSLVTITNDEYEANSSVAGTYSAKIRVLYASGESLETTKTIEVLEEEEGITNASKSFWDKVCDFFKGIGDWFVKIWNTITGWFE